MHLIPEFNVGQGLIHSFFLEKENVRLNEENEVLKNICEELRKSLDQREEVHFIIPPFKYMLSIRTTFSN